MNKWMISQRVRGFYDLFVRLQLVVVLVYYWIHFAIFKAWYGLVPAPATYLVYSVLILLGILVEAFQRYDRDASWLQRGVVYKHQVALRQTVYAAGAVVVYLVATKDTFVSRVFLFTLVPALHLLLFGSAWVLPPRLARLFFRNQRIERTVFLGSSERIASLRSWFERKAALGFIAVGVITDDDRIFPSGVPVLGQTADWERLVAEHKATQMVLADSSAASMPLPMREMAGRCEQLGVRLLVLSDLEQKFGHTLLYTEDDGLHFFSLRREPLERPMNRILKRLLDIGVALPVTIFLLPVAGLCVWLVQRIQSPGPLFYRQSRMGLQHRTFTIIKFRTMHAHNPDEARQASAQDDRIFAAGRFLRRYSIDELPQFWNVLRGEMSVVGPRPHLIEHNQQFARILRNYYVRSFVKPGITGLAQVRGFRGETKDDDKLRKRVESDINYLENWSLSMDLIIIMRTIGQVLVPPQTAV